MEAFSALPYYESSRLEFTPRHTHMHNGSGNATSAFNTYVCALWHCGTLNTKLGLGHLFSAFPQFKMFNYGSVLGLVFFLLLKRKLQNQGKIFQ